MNGDEQPGPRTIGNMRGDDEEELRYSSATASEGEGELVIKNNNTSVDDDIEEKGEIINSQGDLTLYVSGIPASMDEPELREMMAKFGPLTRLQIMVDPHRPVPHRGFGFVAYERKSDAEAAMKELNGLVISGKTLLLEPARSSQPHAPTPGAYKGQRRDRDRRGDHRDRHHYSSDSRRQTRRESRDTPRDDPEGRYSYQPPRRHQGTRHRSRSPPRMGRLPPGPMPLPMPMMDHRSMYPPPPPPFDYNAGYPPQAYYPPPGYYPPPPPPHHYPMAQQQPTAGSRYEPAPQSYNRQFDSNDRYVPTSSNRHGESKRPVNRPTVAMEQQAADPYVPERPAFYPPASYAPTNNNSRNNSTSAGKNNNNKNNY